MVPLWANNALTGPQFILLITLPELQGVEVVKRPQTLFLVKEKTRKKAGTGVFPKQWKLKESVVLFAEHHTTGKCLFATPFMITKLTRDAL